MTGRTLPRFVALHRSEQGRGFPPPDSRCESLMRCAVLRAADGKLHNGV
nr:MAG TPA: hypothetical protein [Caudoviricetes sp.]